VLIRAVKVVLEVEIAMGLARESASPLVKKQPKFLSKRNNNITSSQNLAFIIPLL
jgi:hypothetical protein